MIFFIHMDLVYFSYYFFNGLQHMEVPRLGLKLELLLRPTPQPQQHQIQVALWQCQILNPLVKARDLTHIFTDTMSGS